MAERYIGRILPGQDVCDVNGDKVGSVAHVYREDEAMMGTSEPVHEEVIEVKTGIFGLGEKLYVPVTAVDDTTENAVFVAKPRDQFEDAWHEKPEYLDKLN
ncbi:MAG TPA: DUF2171 domain-containing protein [Chloroflexota bacterium]|jgi:hypothetical protein|nr:DUF2171 domain-containing protein [Chloroflexota bacterium]